MAVKMKSPASRKRTILFCIIACIVLVGAYGIFAYSANKWPFKAPKATKIVKPAYTPNQKKNIPPAGPDAGKTSNQVPVSTSLTASITNLSETNQEVNFTSTITGSSDAGTCVVTFSTPNDVPVTKQFTPTLNGQTATCGPLTIPAQDFTYIGTWTATLHYYVGTEQATTQQDIDIK